MASNFQKDGSPKLRPSKKRLAKRISGKTRWWALLKTWLGAVHDRQDGGGCRWCGFVQRLRQTCWLEEVGAAEREQVQAQTPVLGRWKGQEQGASEAPEEAGVIWRARRQTEVGRQRSPEAGREAGLTGRASHRGNLDLPSARLDPSATEGRLGQPGAAEASIGGEMGSRLREGLGEVASIRARMRGRSGTCRETAEVDRMASLPSAGLPEDVGRGCRTVVGSRNRWWREERSTAAAAGEHCTARGGSWGVDQSRRLEERSTLLAPDRLGSTEQVEVRSPSVESAGGVEGVVDGRTAAVAKPCAARVAGGGQGEPAEGELQSDFH